MPLDFFERVRDLYARFAVRGVPPRWYVVAALLPVVLALTSLWIRGLTGEIPLSVASLPLAAVALGKGVVLSPVAAFEEVGWRGFALPRLQTRFSALASSLILELVWALWHLPLFWLGAFAYAGASFLWWAVEVLAVSTLITWLFNSGRGSLWLPCLYHGVANMTSQTLSIAAGSWVSSLVAAAVALGITANWGHRNLSRAGRRECQE